MNDIEKLPIDKESARLLIGGLRQDIYMLGANDSEFSFIESILVELETGDISPQNAVDQVMAIKERKQSYH